LAKKGGGAGVARRGGGVSIKPKKTLSGTGEGYSQADIDGWGVEIRGWRGSDRAAGNAWGQGGKEGRGRVILRNPLESGIFLSLVRLGKKEGTGEKYRDLHSAMVGGERKGVKKKAEQRKRGLYYSPFLGGS